MMRLYLDSADDDAWERLLPYGIFHGITTNPLLAQRAGLSYTTMDWAELIARAARYGVQEIHLQVYGSPDTYQGQAQQWYELGRDHEIDVVVKIPLVKEAIAVVPEIKSLGGKILMTACYGASQMPIALALEADYIAPYVGRMVEQGIDAMAELKAMNMANQTADHPCALLLASIRSLEQLRDLMGAGHHIFTLSPDLAEALLDHPMSIKARNEFEQAASSGGLKS